MGGCQSVLCAKCKRRLRSWVKTCCIGSFEEDEPEKESDTESAGKVNISDRRKSIQWPFPQRIGPIAEWYSQLPAASAVHQEEDWTELAPLLTKSALMDLIRIQPANLTPCNSTAVQPALRPKSFRSISESQAEEFLNVQQSPLSNPDFKDFWNELNHTFHCLQSGLPVLSAVHTLPRPATPRKNNLLGTDFFIPPSSKQFTPPPSPVNIRVRSASPFAIRSNRKVFRFPVAYYQPNSSGIYGCLLF